MLAVSIPSPAWDPNSGSRSSSWLENDVQEGSRGRGRVRRHPGALFASGAHAAGPG